MFSASGQEQWPCTVYVKLSGAQQCQELLEAEDRGLINHLNINKSKALGIGFFRSFPRMR